MHLGRQLAFVLEITRHLCGFLMSRLQRDNAASRDPDGPDRVRQEIITLAARLMHEGQVKGFAAARIQAARSLFRTYIPPDRFPTDAEIAQALGRLEPVRGDRCPGDGATADIEGELAFFASLLRPLERVEMPRRDHPEGNALDHVLQVFQLVHDRNPYDVELLQAALLHEVGRAIDPWEPISAGLEMLCEAISERTYWLIEQLPVANGRFDGTTGTRAKNRLAAAEDADELMLLSECDRAGRVPGGRAPGLEDALAILGELSSDEFSADSEGR